MLHFVAGLRIGGEKRTFDDHVLVIGDAAGRCGRYMVPPWLHYMLSVGFVDPMTGEGIHTAMESGKTAASVLEDALTVGNFDAAVLEEYQNRWLNSFGTDFYW
jgi:flavin-dependent dehydrogenase